MAAVQPTERDQIVDELRRPQRFSAILRQLTGQPGPDPFDLDVD